MIECRGVEQHDFRVSAFMLGMAVLAVVLCVFWQPAVKAGFPVQVIKNIFMIMTFQAKVALFFLAGSIVALITVLLVFLMRLGNRTRHNQGFQRFGITDRGDC